MTSGPITLTVGWIGRHTPPGAGVHGRDAAVIDVAQDLLLRQLHYRGVLDALVFKGGTSLRKLYAGNQGRFSRPGKPLLRAQLAASKRYAEWMHHGWVVPRDDPAGDGGPARTR
jgi:hypothetical protein